MLIRFITFGENPAVVIGRSRGLFASRGLEVETTITRSSTQQMSGLSQGIYDVASTAFDNVLAWSGREGADIHAVACASQRMSLPVYVRPEIGDWEDLRGRLLAVDAVDTAYALVLRRILLAHGRDLDRGDYRLDPVGATGPRYESMTSGKTFAGILNPPWDKRAEEAGLRRMADYREVLPNYPGGVFAVTTRWADAHRTALVAFLKCLGEAVDWGNDPPTVRTPCNCCGKPWKSMTKARPKSWPHCRPPPSPISPGSRCRWTSASPSTWRRGRAPISPPTTTCSTTPKLPPRNLSE